MGLPVIGLTIFRYTNRYGYPYQGVSQAYVEALVEAGACPLLIPLGLPEEALEEALGRLDGMLFSGGGDIKPETYGSQAHRLVSEVDEDRDRSEIHLMRGILQREMPFFGICRGLQLVNVALGGSLYEDIQEQHPNGMQHQFFPEQRREFLAHEVQVDGNSRLAGVLGSSSVEVNSLHHQGVKRLASELRATAYAPDGIIEAFELPDYPYGLAVQWHPENLQAHAPMRALFKAFVEAARR